MSGLYILIAIPVVSLVLITLVSAWEKRLVWPYVPADTLPPERVPPVSTQAYATGVAAADAGFTWLGTYGDAKGKMYHIRYDFFRSPSGDVLATVGSGAVASIPVQTTWLHTLLADGQCLVTFDSQTGGEIDLTGRAEEILMKGLGFDGLLGVHRARIAVSRPVEPFEAANPLGDLRAYRQSRADRLTAQGYATFLDWEKNAWRYSIKGAIVLAFRQYFTGLRREVVPDKISPMGKHIR